MLLTPGLRRQKKVCICEFEARQRPFLKSKRKKEKETKKKSLGVWPSRPHDRHDTAHLSSLVWQHFPNLPTQQSAGLTRGNLSQSSTQNQPLKIQIRSFAMLQKSAQVLQRIWVSLNSLLSPPPHSALATAVSLYSQTLPC